MYLPKNCLYISMYRMGRWVHIKIFNIKLYIFYVSYISSRKTMQFYHVHVIALLITYQQYLLKWVEGSCPVKEVHDTERRFAVYERRIIGMIRLSWPAVTCGFLKFEKGETCQTILVMLENPRRGRHARNFTTNVPKILDLKSSSEQLFSKNWRWYPW